MISDVIGKFTANTLMNHVLDLLSLCSVRDSTLQSRKEREKTRMAVGGVDHERKKHDVRRKRRLTDHSLGRV